MAASRSTCLQVYDRHQRLLRGIHCTWWIYTSAILAPCLSCPLYVLHNSYHFIALANILAKEGTALHSYPHALVQERASKGAELTATSAAQRSYCACSCSETLGLGSSASADASSAARLRAWMPCLWC